MNTQNTKVHMNQTLTSVLSNGKPVKKEVSQYRLVNPTALGWQALKALDDGKEEEFVTEVEVESSDLLGSNEVFREVYAARFTRHASWGLKADMDTADHGKFVLWLEFVRDAE